MPESIDWPSMRAPRRRRRFLLLVIAALAVIVLATGAGVMLEWPTIALFWYAAPAAGGFLDPVFGKPLNFFLFSLPGWQLIVGWLLTLVLMTCVLAVFFILITGGIRAFLGRSRTYVTPPWRGLSVTFAFLLLILAVRVYLGRFEQLFDGHTIFAGVTYSDAHIMLPGMLAVCAALILGALIASANAVRVPRGRWIAAAILPAALCYVSLLVVGWYVRSFIVRSEEHTSELQSHSDLVCRLLLEKKK